ncbi:MAG TPA: hypothetical protein PLN96_07260 [Zoogloea sp.]|uniref:hypothetical protein n=1 Tax=Zoogloea sp. TaxID=49181 RepID=UPI002C45CB0B|nr:hypothetical protein [Zoogloea sp.]HMV17683.1 hypothetical protein [Rhodocyclaceae bacterium]HMV62930.1 hypothetical protein [Rhodocyclaceae bacterium]HMW51450.1 hypothetical protein [Rhodocyclaceae bacterium]HMY50058.1 hypothetical protein [Rhodocyclaceae bacterium]HMZ76343.1 hypothetical protein [Rhodocyclaceae bacterium]
MLRRLRIAVLLLILASVALTAWRSQARIEAWRSSLHVTVYPIAADDAPATRRYIESLTADTFDELEDWFEAEFMRHGKALRRPLAFNLAPPLTALPPPFPAGGSALATARWSLQLRLWAWRHERAPGPAPDVRLFLLFHDPARTPTLAHSVGLEKGRIGLVQLFARRSETPRNAVIIAHELLHTLGAADRYDPVTLHPRWPDGYAEPDRTPRWPQHLAEIMGGRIPVDAGRADIPDGLHEALIGAATAAEIGLSAPRP